MVRTARAAELPQHGLTPSWQRRSQAPLQTVPGVKVLSCISGALVGMQQQQPASATAARVCSKRLTPARGCNEPCTW